MKPLAFVAAAPGRRALTLGLVLSLAACNAPAPRPAATPIPGSVLVTPPGFSLPEGSDCAAKIARYRAVQDNDLSMGHVAQSVYNQVQREIAGAEKACAAGQDSEARAMIAASQQRHGYPAE